MSLIRMFCGVCKSRWAATPLAAQAGCPFCGEQKNVSREGEA